nr:MAG TPA_asm: hypothetical protein [Caudoviricetes sp.]
MYGYTYSLCYRPGFDPQPPTTYLSYSYLNSLTV